MVSGPAPAPGEGCRTPKVLLWVGPGGTGGAKNTQSSQVRWGGEQGAAGSCVPPFLGVGRVLGHPLGHPPAFQGAGSWGSPDFPLPSQVCPGDGHILSCAGLTLLIPAARRGGHTRHGLFLVTKLVSPAGKCPMGQPRWHSTGGTEPRSGICWVTRWWQESWCQERE